MYSFIIISSRIPNKDSLLCVINFYKKVGLIDGIIVVVFGGSWNNDLYRHVGFKRRCGKCEDKCLCIILVHNNRN